MELAQEKGISTWVTAPELPIEEHGFALHKAAFKDNHSLRYSWPLQKSPSHCSCGQPFTVDHALTCKTGGFPAARHNEVRDITEVCHGVTTEPHLQLLSGESLSHRLAIAEEGTQLDVAMYGFWGGRFEKAFVDVKISTLAPNQLIKCLLCPYIADTSKKIEDSMMSKCVKLNMQHSHHWSCQQQMAWDELQQPFSRNLLRWWPRKEISPML